MKVLLAHNHYHPPSGENIVFNNEKELLRKYGVEVVTYERSNTEIDEFGPYQKVKLALTAVWSKNTYAQISKLIQQTSPQIAHFHNTFPLISPSAYAACQDHGVPVVQTLHNYRLICPGAMLHRNGHPCEDCVGKNLFQAVLHRCYKNSFFATAALCRMLQKNRRRGTYHKLVNRYIALSDFAVSRMTMGGFPKHKFIVKPNFLPSITTLETTPDKKRGYAIYAGLLSKEKGVRTLVPAWKHIDYLPLKVIGDGPLRRELEKEAERYGLNIEFLGYRSHEEVIKIVQQASLQVIPSEWYETFGMVVIEAYQCGIPVVASRIGSLAEIVIDGQSGLLFEPGNAQDLAQKINMLVTNTDLASKLADRARRIFDERYTEDRNFEILIDIYQRAIEDFAMRGGPK